MTDLSLAQDLFLDIFDGAPVRELGAGEVLIHAGAAADKVFNIVSGMLMVSRTGGDGRRQVLSFLFRDNFVGLTATDRYYFTVQAVVSTQVACRPRQNLLEKLSANPEYERTFLNMLFRVLEDAFDLIYSIGQRTAVERLAVFVLYMRHWQRLSEGMVDDGDERLGRVDLPMSREDIADFLGLKKETVSRSFKQLEIRSLLRRLDNDAVEILDLNQLRQLAGIWDFAAPRRITRLLP